MSIETWQAKLDLINSVIIRRLQGDAYSSYTIQQRQWAGTPTEKLEEMAEKLEQKISNANGGGFSLMEPFCD